LKTTPIPVQFSLWLFWQFFTGLRANKLFFALLEFCLFAKGANSSPGSTTPSKLTWLALGEDQAARFREVEQLTAL
jgi:hypothetical protein